MSKLLNRNEWFIFALGTVVTVLIVGGLYFYMEKERSRDVEVISSNYSLRIESIMNAAFHKTDILKSVAVMKNGDISEEEFNILAESVHDNAMGIRAVQFLPHGVVKYCYPIESNEKAIGGNVFKNPKRAADAKLAVESRSLALSGPYVLTQGGMGIVARNPIFLKDAAGKEYFWGFSVVVLDLPDALDTAGLDQISLSGYEYQLYCINELGEKMLISGNEKLNIDDAVLSSIKVPHHEWKLALYPKFTYDYLMLAMLFIFGLIVSFLLSYTYGAIIRAKASQAKSQFMSRVSHELRTPMNAIISFAELGCESKNVEQARYYLSRIGESTDYLLGLIKDVLDMSGLAEKKIVLTEKPYRMQELQTWLGDMFRIRAQQKNIMLSIDLKNDDGCALLVDKSRLEQAAANLVENSLRFTDVGGCVKVIINVVERNDKQAKIALTVADNGIGISKAFQSKMFEPFEQEDDSKTTVNSGNGLGLSIVKKIVELMRGEISVVSEKGQGCEVTITFTAQVSSKNALEWQQSHNDYSGLRQKRILLVEDHPINTKIATKLLERQGMIVDTAADGRQGVDRFLASVPYYYDAILMDIRMPVLDGLGAARQIRSLERPDSHSVPIIAVTANAYDEDKRKSYEAGMNAHLVKPIDAAKLYEMLAYFVLQQNKVG